MEYQGQQDQKQAGKIKDAQGSGQQARYTVLKERPQRVEQVSDRQIERELK
ncbi:hypothetical protein [Streptomyces griseofuscus]|uniref:hypothetical protein n=1 Tax=Streptomyces griseofuscus TaxID=146922 RepID=UPI00340A9BB9